MKKKILIGLGVALLSVLVIVGGVFAAGYFFWEGTANISVVESMTVAAIAQTGGGTWDAGTKTWAVSMKPSEVKTLTLRVTNTGTAPLLITPTIAGVVAGLTPSFTPGGPIPGGAFYDFVFTMTASGSVAPGGPYGFIIGFTRE
jgi:hypothetical protein